MLTLTISFAEARSLALPTGLSWYALFAHSAVLDVFDAAASRASQSPKSECPNSRPAAPSVNRVTTTDRLAEMECEGKTPSSRAQFPEATELLDDDPMPVSWLEPGVAIVSQYRVPTRSAPEVIEIISSDEEDAAPRKRPRVDAMEADYDDVVIVSHVVRGRSNADLAIVEHGAGVASGNSAVGLDVVENGGNTGAGEVEVVGARRGIRVLEDFPHFRFQCAKKHFNKHSRKAFLQFCPRCYCYVCDDYASQCQAWYIHAKAVDTDRMWRKRRAAASRNRKSLSRSIQESLDEIASIQR